MIGGVLAATSYKLAFYGAAAGMVVYSLLLLLFAVETLPRLKNPEAKIFQPKEKFGGYGDILKDIPFFSYIAALTLIQVCAVLVWVLLGVYAKQNYHVPESQYGLIPTTNAIMVVTLQMAFTRVTKRYSPLPVLMIGALFYTMATGSVAVGQGFWGFWISIVVMTIGELILVPTASTYVANLAPADKRGRYMSLAGLTWGAASGIGPVFGGFLNDNLGPHSIWWGGAFNGFLSVMSFLFLSVRNPAPTSSY